MPDRPAAHSNTASSRVTYVTKNIEAVRIGEAVVAWDPVTGELGRHEVTNTSERTADHLRVLEFAAEDDGQTQTLETTDEHPFWSVEAGDFVAAGDLAPGDRFISPAGEFSTLVATHRDEHPEGVAVYNFEVADVHNYYVRAHGLRGPPIRVHNAQGYGVGASESGVTWRNGWRTSDGKFASPRGKGRPGAEAEVAIWDAVSAKPGWRVIRGPVSVRDATGQLRVYDGTAISPSNRAIGLEIKSGAARRTPAQRYFDTALNGSGQQTLPVVGRYRGINIRRAIQLWWP